MSKTNIISAKLLLVMMCIILQNTSGQVTDFTYYPEDTTITTDFIWNTDEKVYSAHYFSDSSTIIPDARNGIAIQPYSDVNCFIY
jgi:hypothetical protein